MESQHNGVSVPSSFARSEPIAVIGIGCRFPGGVTDTDSYWRLLSEGVDAISETPADRWSLERFYLPGHVRPGKTQSRWGGYVEDIDRFDPQLFGISPKEAASMDPQQRMLLEVAWRAFEDARQPLDQIAGRDVAVYTGISSFDYAVAGLSPRDRGEIGPYSNTGGSSSIAANRLSYCFDLRGPSVAVDTACSSSLVALHLACESLARGESEMALAGGVNALILPDFYVAFSQLGVLSPDGRCKAFDARANGYVRSEGAGMVLLKPLSQALRDRDPIYCVIRATAVNQDGRTPGLTVPSREAQRELVRAACKRGGCDPVDVQYVEAHGTGTSVGDPIEAHALSEVLCAERNPADPCRIGSVKTNLGHLEAGAGMASLIKVALSLHHRQIPAHLHLEQPNPEIDFEALKLHVPQKTEPWTSPGRKRLAGVNGFGYGGANAHVLVEEAPLPLSRASAKREANGVSIQTHLSSGDRSQRNGNGQAQRRSLPQILPLSAHSPGALREMVGQFSAWLSSGVSQASIAEIAAAVAHRRNHFEHRYAVTGRSIEEWAEALDGFDSSDTTRSVSGLNAYGRRGPNGHTSGPLFVCCGQGPQWWAMGRRLYKTNATYRKKIDDCDQEFANHVDWSVTQELHRDESDSRMQETAIAQPSLFAMQVALAACWAEAGVTPGAIVGHSVGEIAAAHLAGALSFQDACLVAIERGRTMDLASSRGAMIAVGISDEQARDRIERLGVDVSVAAVNGPTSVTISGETGEVERLARAFEQAGVFCKRLAVEYAFHSRQMEPVRSELLKSLSTIRPGPTRTELISTVSGRPISGELLDAEYWWNNVRQGVQFADAMAYAAEHGFDLAVELGPHPVLTYSIHECVRAYGGRIDVVPSLRRDKPDEEQFAASVAKLYNQGQKIDWSGIVPPAEERLSLPLYPFQTQRLWVESEESKRSRLAKRHHPLLGDRAERGKPVWRSRLDLNLQRSLRDHRVLGTCMLPAAAMVEVSAAAARQLTDSSHFTLSSVRFHRACLLDEEVPLYLETAFDPERRKLRLFSRAIGRSDWSELASVELIEDAAEIAPLARSLDEVRARCREGFNADRCYDYCEQLGLQYGDAFRGIQNGWRCDGEAVADVELPDSENLGGCDGIDPAILDSCFHAMIAADGNFDHTFDGLYLPKQISRVQFFRPVGKRARVHVRLIAKNDRRTVAHIDVRDADGKPCLLLRDFVSERVGHGGKETVDDWLYCYRWEPLGIKDEGIVSVDQAAEQLWCLFVDEGGVADDLSERLRQRGGKIVRIERASVSRLDNPDRYQLNPESKDDFNQLLTKLLAEESRPLHLVYLWGMDAPDPQTLTTGALESSTVITTLAPLHLVQAWEENATGRSARLTVVTRGAQTLEEPVEQISIAQTPLIGFSRVVISETASLRTKLVDVAADHSLCDVDALAEELNSREDVEDEVMIRAGERFVHRFVKYADQPLSGAIAPTLRSSLGVGRSYGIDELRYSTRSPATLTARDVEIKVAASGLNFSDVMKSLNLYPGDDVGPLQLGAECCGEVTRIGEAVTEFAVGEKVIAVAPGSFATHVTVDADLVAKKPSGMTDEEAASIAIAFLTASHALEECARIRSGDKVLVHSASGGVGLAAIQIAHSAGATVFATAGNEEKRAFVSEKGASRVMNSRSLRFADEVLEATAGEGVDIVLNSLPGEAIARGLECLKVGGRFLEIGKRDIYDDASLGMLPLRNNLALFAIDLDQLCKTHPSRIGERLRQLVDRFESGELAPLPVKTWSAGDTDAAFRFMQQAKHIGKVTVRYGPSTRTVYPGEHEPVAFRQDAAYWIVGGLGGFGLEIARWLADRGAGTLVLSGRRETLSPEATKVLGEIESSGVQVRVIPVDVTDMSAVERTLRIIDRELPPLRGVIHTAMVLQDSMLSELDRQTLEKVLRPKVLGGWNLHQATAARELDQFILFSSLSSVFGHAGQANYSAANALLDGLAYFRRAQGLPACVINWGHLGEVGYLARREDLAERIERQGVLSFSVKQATESLSHALQTRAIQASVLRMDWSRWRGLGITGNVSPRFARLVQHTDAVNEPAASVEEIRGAEPRRRAELVQTMLSRKVESLLGFGEGELEVQRSLLELGIDSLMAVELRNWVEGQLQLPLPVSELMQGASVSGLVESICQELSEEDDATETSCDRAALVNSNTALAERIDAEQAVSLLETLPEMPQQEVSVLLTRMLREQETSIDDPA